MNDREHLLLRLCIEFTLQWAWLSKSDRKILKGALDALSKVDQ